MAGTIPAIAEKSTFLRSVLRSALNRQPVEKLRNSGYSYSQVAEALDLLLALGHLVQEKGNFRITQSGRDYLSGKEGTKYVAWLSPLDEERIAKIPLSEPYLPVRESMADIIERNSI